MGSDAFILRDDVPNVDILDAIRAGSSTDYQTRIPTADKAGLRDTINALMDPNNRRWKNEFIDALVNRIGLTIARSNSWSNPLAPFKRGLLQWGNTIEEIQVGLLRAHSYDPDVDYMEKTLFGRETPEVQTNFHTVNRQDFYKVTVNEALLSRAFLDPNGLSGFVNQLMEAPTTSDQLDEFLLTTSLFAEYEGNGGFYHVRVPDVSDFESSAEDAKLALRKMRAMAGNLKFLNTKYNAAGMPVFAKPEDLLLFVTPEYNAAIDVEALAGAFNIDRAAMYGRIIEIPEENFGINHCQAIMTTSEFFVMADQKFESTSQWNPANLHNNYFLHHWQVISASRFVPAIMFTTEADDEVITISAAPTSVSAVTLLPDNDGNVPAGINHGGVVALTASIVPAGADQGVRWSVTGGGVGTFITPTGILHLGAADPIVANAKLHVTASSTWRNPDRAMDPSFKSVAFDVNVLDNAINLWPGSVSELTTLKVLIVDKEVQFNGGTTYAVTLPDGTELDEDDIVVEADAPITSSVTIAGPNASAPHYVVTVAVNFGPDSAAAILTYNVTFV